MEISLKLLFFSLLRDVTGEVEISYTLPVDSTVGDLLKSLYARWPKLEEWDRKVLVAADQEYVTREAVLKDGQEVAVMPPVQGG